MLTVMDAEHIAEALVDEIRRLWPESVEQDEINDLATELVIRRAVANLLADGVIAPGPRL